MPTPDEILAGLSAITNGAWMVAAGWHVALLALVVSLAIGWRPSRRLSGAALAVPLASVSAAAWVFGNPLNGTAFALLSAATLVLGINLSAGPVARGPRWSWLVGVLMVAFGWSYPHFLEIGLPLGYLYAAPFGIIPCPTLSGVIGLSLLGDGFGGRAWGMVLGVAGALYGLFGLVRLGVGMDAVLVVGAVALMVRALRPGSLRE